MAAINLDISTKLDITCRRNDTFSLELTMKDANGDPIDLTQYSDFLMEVRRHDRKTGTATLSMRSSSNEINGNSEGVLSITKDAGDMNISGGNYVYDLQSTKNGVVATWLRGKFTINEDVTI